MIETILPMAFGILVTYIAYSFFFSSKKKSKETAIVDSLRSTVHTSVERINEQIKVDSTRDLLEFDAELTELGLDLSTAHSKVTDIRAMLNGEAPKSEPTNTTKDQ